jgi:hypothetical protein
MYLLPPLFDIVTEPKELNFSAQVTSAIPFISNDILKMSHPSQHNVDMVRARKFIKNLIKRSGLFKIPFN